ncbi:uncharacterized, partial [Tachysurus ichikawai]
RFTGPGSDSGPYRFIHHITFLVSSHQRDLRERRLHRCGLESCHFDPQCTSASGGGTAGTDTAQI